MPLVAIELVKASQIDFNHIKFDFYLKKNYEKFVYFEITKSIDI